MTERSFEGSRYALGGALILAMVIGGGTSAGLYTDAVIQVATILAVTFALSRPARHAPDRRLLALAAVALLVIALQIVPLPNALIAPLRPELLRLDTTLSIISLGAGRTIECLLFVVTVAAFLMALMRFDRAELLALLPFFFAGLVCNMVAAVMQFSLASTTAMESVLPYRIGAGLFANASHFSALLFVSIPLLIQYSVQRGRWVLGLLGLLAVLILLLAAGSRAGVLIGFAVTVLALLLLVPRTGFGKAAVPALLAILAIFVAAAWTGLIGAPLDPALGRGEIAATTLSGIGENWPLGVGFGGFANAYQIYERPEMIFRQYVNHAHNDYLEIIFEGGLLAGLALASYLVLLSIRLVEARLNGMQKAALMAIGFLLVHSLVDYPMRTLALAIVFAYLNAIVFCRDRGSGRLQS